LCINHAIELELSKGKATHLGGDPGIKSSGVVGQEVIADESFKKGGDLSNKAEPANKEEEKEVSKEDAASRDRKALTGPSEHLSMSGGGGDAPMGVVKPQNVPSNATLVPAETCKLDTCLDPPEADAKGDASVNNAYDSEGEGKKKADGTNDFEGLRLEEENSSNKLGEGQEEPAVVVLEETKDPASTVDSGSGSTTPTKEAKNKVVSVCLREEITGKTTHQAIGVTFTAEPSHNDKVLADLDEAIRKLTVQKEERLGEIARGTMSSTGEKLGGLKVPTEEVKGPTDQSKADPPSTREKTSGGDSHSGKTGTHTK